MPPRWLALGGLGELMGSVVAERMHAVHACVMREWAGSTEPASPRHTQRTCDATLMRYQRRTAVLPCMRD